jgi:hypothetical protein
MSTPLEDTVLATFLADLLQKNLSDELVQGLGLAFSSPKLPTAEVLAELIKLHSGDKLA